MQFLQQRPVLREQEWSVYFGVAQRPEVVGTANTELSTRSISILEASGRGDCVLRTMAVVCYRSSPQSRLRR